MGFDEAGLLNSLETLPVPSGWLVAYSGGLDSSVLLCAMARLRARLAQPLRAVHIHHGLLPHADAWTRHCQAVCERLAVPLEVVRLELEVPPGESLEAVARAARYRAIAGLLRPGEMLLTAQHRDDQAETFLLQALRGAGIDGLAGMPRCRPWHAGWQARPLLDFPRVALRAWAEEQGIEWIDDPSNRDRRFDRNHLRHAVMPMLRERWPGAGQTLARSAGHLAEGLAVLREVAQADLDRCRAGRALRLDCLAGLSPGRRALLLRAWIREQGHALPDQRRMRTIASQIQEAAADRSPRIDWGDVSLRRYRDRLYLTPNPLPEPPESGLAWPDASPLRLPSGCGELRLEEAATGLPVRYWHEGRVRVRWPAAGLRCRLPGRSGSRSLKKLCQEAGIPPWQRPYLPLIHVDQRLVAIGGLGLCETEAEQGPCVQPRWQPGF